MDEPQALSRRQTMAGLGIILGLGIVILFLFVRNELAFTGGVLGAPLDDTWIHFQFARNLSQGDGFSFNPGTPTPGSTAPLWTVMLAGIGMFSQDFLSAAIGLSASFFLLTIALTYGLAAQLSDNRIVGLIAALGMLLSGRLIWAGLAGMETTAFTALSVAGVWVYSKKGLNAGSAVLFGLASQARPEGHLLFALAVADTMLDLLILSQENEERVPRWRVIVRTVALPVVLYGLIALPYTVFSLVQTGRPLPNTFYAKVGGSELFSARTFRETIVLHWRDNPVALLLVIPGIVQTWKRSRLVVAWFILLPILYAFMVDFVWHHGRYTMPLIPFVMIVAAQGVEWLVSRAPERSRSYVMTVAVASLIVAGAWHLPRWARQLGQNANEILVMDVAIGEWLAQNTAADDLIAVDDIGAIGYLSGRTIFDLNGLISPEMWPILHQEPPGLLRGEATTRLLSEVGPDYLAIFPLWHWEMANNPSVVRAVQSFRSDSRTIIGDQEAVVYQAHWPYLQDARVTEKPMATLGEQIQLLDFAMRFPDSAADPLEVTLWWQSLAATDRSYDVFVHVLGPEDAIVAQADSKPVHGLAPTNRWQPGDIIEDRYLVYMSAELAPGLLRIQVGMYERESGRRLAAEAPRTNDGAILLGDFLWQDSIDPG